MAESTTICPLSMSGSVTRMDLANREGLESSASERSTKVKSAPSAKSTRQPQDSLGRDQPGIAIGDVVAQAKLAVGPADDAYEREADAVASRVVRSLQSDSSSWDRDATETGSRVQRRPDVSSDLGGDGDEGDNGDGEGVNVGSRIGRIRRMANSSLAPTDSASAGRAQRRATDSEQPGRIRPKGRPSPAAASAVDVGRIQRAATIGTAGGELDDDTARILRSSRSGGKPLPDPARSKMEGAFGADFGGVRVHSGSVSTELNDRIQAKAFTTGSDIYFRDAVPDVSSSGGQELLAHELTHVVQQNGAGIARRHSIRSAARTVSRAPANKVQRLVSADKLERLSPPNKNSVNYRTVLELVNRYETNTRGLMVGAGLKSSHPMVAGPDLLGQLDEIKALAAKKQKSHPILTTLIADVNHERNAVNKITDSDFATAYQGKSYLEALTDIRSKTAALPASMYPQEDVALPELEMAEAEEWEIGDLEAETDALTAKTSKSKLAALWESLQAKVPNLAMFLEGVAGIAINSAKIGWTVLKAVGKLVWFLVKSTGKMLLEPFINFVKLFTKEGRADLFADTKTLHFERRTGKSGSGWATLEGIGLWLGNIRNWAGWISVVSGLVGIIPGAQPALVISAAAGGINVLAGLASAAVNTLLAGGRALYDYLSSAEDHSVRDRMLLRWLGDMMAVGTATAANAVTNVVGGEKSADALGSEALGANDPSAQAGAVDGLGAMGNEKALAEASKGASADVLGGGTKGEALKQAGVYTPTNAVAGEANNAAEVDKKVAELKKKVESLKKALRPVYDLMDSVGKVFRAIYGAIKWACESMAQMFRYVKNLIVSAAEAATPVINGAITGALAGVTSNLAEQLPVFGAFMGAAFFPDSNV